MKDLLVRKHVVSSDKYGCDPLKRSTDDIIKYGILNLDKPRGPTSHQVTDYVKKILNINKAGHSGTLDPKVTGVLPIALGTATRIVQALLPAGKEYIALMHLHSSVPESVIREVCQEFVGKIQQLPPVKSNVKRAIRTRSIYYLEILEIEEKDVLFKVGTQAGTYIRKLIHDIGQKIGCGAHMAELRRTKAGPFTEETLVTLQDLSDALHFRSENETYLRKIIQPIENAVELIPKIWVMDTAVDAICHGASLKIPGISRLEQGIESGNTVAIMTLKDELVALCKAQLSSKEIMKKDKGLAASSHKVFMREGVYPKVETRRGVNA